MAEEDKKKSFWETLPGIITAIAGLITAIAGLVAVLNSRGKESAPKQGTVSTNSSTTTQSANNNSTSSDGATKEPIPKLPVIMHVESGTNQVTQQKTGEDSVVLVDVPWGCFMMGSPDNDKGRDNDEGPLHKVCVDRFLIGKYEVTQGQWQNIMGKSPEKGVDYPIDNISWDDAQQFIDKLNEKSGKKYRLPTEAEWEYACRAGGLSKYCGSNDVNAVAWYKENYGGSTHPVGQKQANAFGIHDMSGNVWEWCADWYGNYSSAQEQNPLGPISGSERVTRGGGWDDGVKTVRAAARFRLPPHDHNKNLGFRLVLPSR